MLRVQWFLMGAALLVTPGSQLIVSAQESAPANTAKQQALDWIDNYRQMQVLFHDDDIARLRDKIAKGSQGEAEKWLAHTAETRRALDSPTWKSTRDWLRQFLKVQAIYSEKQISEFQDEALEQAQKSPKKFIDMLHEIEQKRNQLAAGSANSRQLRQQQLQITEAYRQEAVAQRDAMREAAAQQSASGASPVTPAEPIPAKNYQSPPPIVTSLDAARGAVLSNFWRPW